MINLKRTVVLNSLILMLTQLFAQGPNTAELTTRTLTARKEAN